MLTAFGFIVSTIVLAIRNTLGAPSQPQHHQKTESLTGSKTTKDPRWLVESAG